MAKLSSTTPCSYQTSIGNYASALLPGFKSKKMQPLGPGSSYYATTMDKNQNRTARGGATVHVDMFAVANRDRSAVSTREYISPRNFQGGTIRIDSLNKTSP